MKSDLLFFVAVLAFLLVLPNSVNSQEEWENEEAEQGEPKFRAEDVYDLRGHLDAAVKRAINMARCSIYKLVSVRGYEIEFRCTCNVLPGDTAVLVVDGQVAAFNNLGETKFFLVDPAHTHAKNYTLVVVDDVGDAFAFGSMVDDGSNLRSVSSADGSTTYPLRGGGGKDSQTLQALEHEEKLMADVSTCNLYGVPPHDISAVIVGNDHKFYYVHFVGRQGTGDMGEDAPDWRGLVPNEIINFFRPSIVRQQGEIQERRKKREGDDIFNDDDSHDKDNNNKNTIQTETSSSGSSSNSSNNGNGRSCNKNNNKPPFFDKKNIHMGFSSSSSSGHLHLSSAPVIIDVGANKGSHTCYPASLGARVYAVEPFQIHAKRLALMQGMNNWDLHVFCGGADDIDGYREIHNTGTNFEMRNVLTEPGKEIVSTWKVPVTRLDTWVQEKEKILMLKIDTDGHEMYTLRGAVGLFRSPGVKYMKIEFIPYSLKTAHPDEPDIALKLLLFLREHGFALYNIPVGSHFALMEWFCHEHLEELRAGEEESLLGAILSHMTPDYPWAMTTLMAVNLQDVNDLALDFPCV